jgi:glycosyltransferase involved in cell wall biosynthesis
MDNYVSQTPLVVVIIAYFNGKRYFQEQLKSLAEQTYTNIHIILSDDGSDEHGGHLEKLLKASKLNYTHIRRKKNVGYSQNFISSIQKAPKNCKYFAFCDQDDIWFPKKIERAVEALKNLEKGKASLYSLYCSRTEIVASDGKTHSGYSPSFEKKPSFGNALIQNIAGGNTMVFNREVAELLIKTSLGRSIVVHDWWTYLIVSGVGGNIFFDPKPSLKYRQHDKNAIGSNNGWAARLKRFKLLLNGQFKKWCDLNVSNLLDNEKFLTPPNRQKLYMFERARKANILFRIYGFWRCKVYRQTRMENFALSITILLKKV